MFIIIIFLSTLLFKNQIQKNSNFPKISPFSFCVDYVSFYAESLFLSDHWGISWIQDLNFILVPKSKILIWQIIKIFFGLSKSNIYLIK